MKDIDTETSVVWPPWCYSDDIRNKLLEPKPDLERDTSECEAEIYVLPPRTHRTQSRKSTSKSVKVSTTFAVDSPVPQIEATITKKMLSERSLLLNGYSSNTIESLQKTCDQSKTPPPLSASQTASITVTPATTAAAAAAYLYLEKVKNERMSPRVTTAQIDCIKDAIMESSAAAAAVAAVMANNNNCSSISNNNNSSTNTCRSPLNSSLTLSQTQTGNAVSSADEQLLTHSQQQQPQQHHSQLLSLNTNHHVKRERLSPSGANGDLQSALSRSRSTTPSSFRETSPLLSVHNSPSESVIPLHNLSTNILNSIQQATSASGRNSTYTSGSVNSQISGLPSDFSTRNYSDFMRSLAAKYNNSNPNESNLLRRQAFFEANSTCTKKMSSPSQKVYQNSQATAISKDVTITTTSILPQSAALSSGLTSTDEVGQLHATNVAVSAVAANAAGGGNVSPFMTTFLSSLPFAQGIFPPLIDMSNTQALISLARAAKGCEIQSILHNAHNLKSSTSSVSPAPSPSLNMALQQAAQFISPALMYSAQHQKQQQTSRNTSPRPTNLSSSKSSSASLTKGKTIADKRNTYPLDLSSQTPASKRFKPESTSSQSSTDGLHSESIKRHASSSTATTTPSPPPAPLNEKTSGVMSTAAEATTTAVVTPTSVGSSTSATSSTSSNIIVRHCQSHSEEVNSWTVQDVCEFVGSIDICADYVKHFREQCIDGSGLPLLTEDHLVNSLGMKLGPALKLRSMLAKKLGGPCPCVSCVAQAQQLLALQTGSSILPMLTTATGSVATTDGVSCHSHSPKPTVTSAKNSASCSISSSATNKNEGKMSSTKVTATSSNTTATGTSSNSIEGVTPSATGNNNCSINIGNFPPSYVPCNNSNSSKNNSSSCINATGNHDNDADSSSLS